MRSSLHLTAIPGRFSVVRLGPAEEIPPWALSEAMFSITKTAEETSVVCHAHLVPAGTISEVGFCCLKVEGPLAFSETGVLASLASPLSNAGISLFAISTFDTDYILVREVDFGRTVATLRSAGHDVEEQGSREHS